MRLIGIAALGAVVLVVAGAALANNSNDRVAAKQATAAFQQLAKAKAAGYTLELKTTPANGSKACIADTAGGMGIHMVNAKLLDSGISLKSPEALVYEPRSGKISSSPSSTSSTRRHGTTRATPRRRSCSVATSR